MAKNKSSVATIRRLQARAAVAYKEVDSSSAIKKVDSSSTRSFPDGKQNSLDQNAPVARKTAGIVDRLASVSVPSTSENASMTPNVPATNITTPVDIQQEAIDVPTSVTAGHELATQPDNMQPLYITKPSAGKGLGIFAAKNIPKGARILTDTPLLSLNKPYDHNDIRGCFETLSPLSKEKYMQLHCPPRPKTHPVVSIWEANAFETGPRASIFLNATRINHSCMPNAHFSWNQNLHLETVHATQPIPFGEEITIAYCSLLRTQPVRSFELRNYLFICRCPACVPGTAFHRASSKRRQQMFDLDQEIASFDTFPDVARVMYGRQDALSAVLQLIGVLNKEGVGLSELSKAYYDTMKLYEKRGEKRKAILCARKMLDVDVCCVGPDSQIVEASRDMLGPLEAPFRQGTIVGS